MKAPGTKRLKLKYYKLLTSFAFNFNLRRCKLEVLTWLRAHGCPWDYYTYQEAAEGGHLEVLRWARLHNCPWRGDGRNITMDAARKGLHSPHLSAQPKLFW